MPAISECAIADALPSTPEPEVVDRIVEWSIDLATATPEEAAQQALLLLRDPESIGTVFRVHNPDGTSVEVDVLDMGNPVVSPDVAVTTVQLGRPYRLLRAVLQNGAAELGAVAGEIVTPVRTIVPVRYPGPQWTGVVARGATVAREVVIPARSWLADVTIY